MKQKIFNLPDVVANDLETLVAKGQQTKWVIALIERELALPDNVLRIASIRSTREGLGLPSIGMPPAEVLPAHQPQKEVALW